VSFPKVRVEDILSNFVFYPFLLPTDAKFQEARMAARYLNEGQGGHPSGPSQQGGCAQLSFEANRSAHNVWRPRR